MKYFIGKSKIATHEIIHRVLVNWREIDTIGDKGFAGRYKIHKEHIANKEPYWDHNTAIIWACDFFQAQSYLEIGVKNCASLIHAIMALSTRHIVGVDAWASDKYAGDKSSYEAAKKRVGKYNSFKFITLIKEMSQTAIPYMHRLGALFDVICVDGDHSPEGAAEDLENVSYLVKKCIIMDDLYHHKHRYLLKVFEDFCERKKFDYIINEQYPGTGIAFTDGVPFDIQEEPFERLNGG